MNLSKCKCLSGSWLKLIAVVSMLIDHTAHILWWDDPAMLAPLFTLAGRSVSLYWLARKVGRLAFPIFCFLIGEGWRHTRSKEKYARNLALFALLSELPFNLMAAGSLVCPGKQNVFVTLFLGVLLLWIYDRNWKELWKALGFLVVGAAALLLKADYGIAGAVLVPVMYALGDKPALRALVSYPLLSGGTAAFCAFAPITLYNGKRGFIRRPWLKYGFYLFYPAHILILFWIRNGFL